jgi:group I intron endonuclease
MFGIIYKVTNIKNNKVYIGATEKSLDVRRQEHINNKERFPEWSFYSALNEFGENNFKWEIIDTVDSLNEKYMMEIYWIDYYKSFIGHKNSNGYNMTLGGGGQLGLSGKLSKNNGKVRSEETRELLRVQKFGPLNPQYNNFDELSPTFKDNIIAINPYTKESILFHSTMDAERKLRIDNSGIVQCLNNKKVFMYGYFWIRKNDYDELQKTDGFDLWLNNKRNSMTYGKPFIGYNEISKYFFNNLSDVKFYGFSPSHVNKCIRNVPKYKTHKGLMWKYITWDEYGEYLIDIE